MRGGGALGAAAAAAFARRRRAAGRLLAATLLLACLPPAGRRLRAAGAAGAPAEAFLGAGARAVAALGEAGPPGGARQPGRRGLLAAAAGALAPAVVAGGGAGSAWAADGAVSSVLDNVGLLTPETREYLEKMVGQVEADTGLKMRVILPKPGQYTDKEYMKPVAVAWGVDRTSLILIVEDAKGGAVANTGKSRGPGAFGKRYLDWSPGFRLQEKYQFRLSRDFFLRNKGKFGTPEYVKENGLDGAVRDAARDVATCYYKLAASQATQNGMASPICGDPFPREQVDAVLGEHGL